MLKLVNGTRVVVVNGQDIYCIGLCEKFAVRIQGQNCLVNVYTLPLDSYNLILGAQWLAGLRDIVWNFRNLTVKFLVGQQQFYLQGEKEIRLRLLSCPQLTKLLMKQHQLVGLQLL